MRQVFRSRGLPLHQDQDDSGNHVDDVDTLDRKTCSPNQQRRTRRNQKFEIVPLDDLSPDIERVFVTGQVPGDDQVSSLSNRKIEHSMHKKKSKSISKPEQKKTKQGCLRGLFKRKVKRNHSSSDEGQVRLSLH